MPSRRILLTSEMPGAGMSLLRRRRDVEVEVLPEPTEANLRARIGEAEAVVMVPEVPVLTAELIGLAPRLKIACRYGAGYDNFDVPALTARGIPLATTADANAVAVAELNFYLMMALAKRGIVYDRSVRAGEWASRRTPDTIELAGRRVLLIGYGRIGRQIARRCAAFDMQVVVADPRVRREAVEADGHRWIEDFHDALGEADVVSLGLSMTPENRGLFSDAEFSRMRPTAFIINTSRGPLVDEAALIRALEAGRIAGAGLDVLEQEPPAPDNKLLRMDRVVLTPHSGAYNRETLERMAVACATNVLDGLDGRLDRRCVVNPEVL